MCERERGREGERERKRERESVCVCDGERESKRESECVCVCVCVWYKSSFSYIVPDFKGTFIEIQKKMKNPTLKPSKKRNFGKS